MSIHKVVMPAGKRKQEDVGADPGVLGPLAEKKTIQKTLGKDTDSDIQELNQLKSLSPAMLSPEQRARMEELSSMYPEDWEAAQPVPVY